MKLLLKGIKLARNKLAYALAVETFSADIEKLRPLCQSGRRQSKAKAGASRRGGIPVAKTLQEHAGCPGFPWTAMLAARITIAL
jgi:hypothetical protein